ncbi:hypothetical protein BWI93_19720 [Siphonobacter sp. BAB-5385]|nr:hypothetical protein BWI93_19720 [Siphonobacter sp. BAB-5385]
MGPDQNPFRFNRFKTQLQEMDRAYGSGKLLRLEVRAVGSSYFVGTDFNPFPFLSKTPGRFIRPGVLLKETDL